MQLNSFRITPKNIIFNTTLNPDSDDDINFEEAKAGLNAVADMGRDMFSDEAAAQ